MNEIEKKQLAQLREEQRRIQRLIDDAEAGPKTATEALFALCAKVRGGKVASDKELCETVVKFLTEEIASAVYKGD